MGNVFLEFEVGALNASSAATELGCVHYPMSIGNGDARAPLAPARGAASSGLEQRGGSSHAVPVSVFQPSGYWLESYRSRFPWLCHLCSVLSSVSQGVGVSHYFQIL